MKITQLRVNHHENPLGFLLEKPSFSWITSDTAGKYQAKAQLQIGYDPEFTSIFYDSGLKKNISSLSYTPDIKLKPYTRYYWRVFVWADNDDYCISEVAWFETGKIDQGFSGKWITTPFDKSVHPMFIKKFSLSKEVKSARAYVTSLGVYEMEINGEKVGNEVLAPFYNDYHKWLQYQTYDITKYVQTGENAVGLLLGNGWYKGRFGYYKDLEELYGDRFGVLCELHITLEDDTLIVINSDESWMCQKSPIMESSIYNGEIYDSRLEIENWSTFACDTTGFLYCEELKADHMNVTERMSPALSVIERNKPKELLITPKGELVIDFGQVMTGWVEFNCRIPKDSRIQLQYGELLQNDNFYNENLRSAKAEYIYISNGKEVHVRPHFTFYGFRYVKVSGLEDICLEDFEACVIHSDLLFTGKITTSNPKVNQLISNAFWSQRDNFLDVPTDCPQRDERMGWTGDAQVFAATASFNMYTPAFYAKYLHDMLLEQYTHEGSVPFVVPDVLERCMELSGDKDANHHGSCAWGDAATIIPWTLYVFYGDKELLRHQYANMKLWVDYIKKQDDMFCGQSRLWKTGFHYADWLALDNYDKSSCFGGTDPYYVASAYYYYSAKLLSKAAKVLAYKEDENYYKKLSEEVKDSIQKEYFTPNGRLAVDTQTALIIALYMDFVPTEFKARIIDDLKRKLDDNKVHLTTGFVGTYYICQVLSEYGLNEYAYTLLFNEDFPSWLYEINMGATTIWERWNSVLENGLVSDTGMNSMNHYAYGSIVEWMYRYMCGIAPSEEIPGFKSIILKPHFDKRMDWVEAEYLSASGLIQCRWKKTFEGYEYCVTVPFDTQARLSFQDKFTSVSINGTLSQELTNNKVMELEHGVYIVKIII